MRNIEVLQKDHEEGNILKTVKRGETNWICHRLLWNCVLKHLTEGNVEGNTEVTGRRGRRSKELLDGPKEKRVY